MNSLRTLVAMASLHLFCSSLLAQDFELTIGDARVDPPVGSVTLQVDLTYLLPGEAPVSGLNFGVSHAGSGLVIEDFEVLPTQGFYSVDQVDGGWTFYGIFAHSVDHISGTMPLVRVTYSTSGLAPGEVAPLVFAGDIGSPNVGLTLYGSGVFDEVPFSTLDGSITAGVPFIRGDANDDGMLGLPDIIWIQNYLFLGGEPAPCLDSMDSNGDGTLSLSDILVLAFYSFLDGPPPAAPFPECEYVESVLGCAATGCP